MKTTIKIIATAAAILVAMLSLATSAGADASVVARTEVDYGVGVMRTCGTPYGAGTQGYAGAWGAYVDGCTVSVVCPPDPITRQHGSCTVSGRSIISTDRWNRNHRVTLNSRLRVDDANSGTVIGWTDKSCAGVNFCRVEDVRTIRVGHTASVQCNGVHQTAALNRARVRCQINMSRRCTGADTPVDQLSQPVAEANVLCLMNQERESRSIAALAPKDQLGNAARSHANDAVSIKWWRFGVCNQPDACWPHRNPVTGTLPQQRIAAAGYCPDAKYAGTATGENAYFGISTGTYPAPTPRKAVDWWMNHHVQDGFPVEYNGHRKAILSPDYTQVGNGVVAGNPTNSAADRAGTFVQNFGSCVNIF